MLCKLNILLIRSRRCDINWFRYIQNLKDAHAVITFDADGQHSVDDAIKFAHEIKKCDENIIFGSRFIENKINIPPLKRFVLCMVTLITNKLIG